MFVGRKFNRNILAYFFIFVIDVKKDVKFFKVKYEIDKKNLEFNAYFYS